MLDQLRRRPAILVGLVVAAIACWAVVTPEGGGPDEATHMVRSAGVARGQFGQDDAAYDIPDEALPRDVSCWVFDPRTPASCATPRETVGATIEVPSTAWDYPVWSHLYAGLASRLPGASPLWWARIANLVLAGGLVGASLLAVRRRPLAAASVLAALTPMAWFSFGIVNPSSMAIAGAIALWVGLVHRPDLPWLTAIGFTATALPRRDGLIWACLAIGLWLLIDDRRFASWWRSLRTGPGVLIVAATAATMTWGFRAASTTSQLVVLAPAAIVGAELLRAARARLVSAGDPTRVIGAAVTAAAGALGLLAAAMLRPGGWDAEFAGRVLGQAGANLVEAIGRLGWLDTPLPTPVIVGWVAIVGVLAGASLADRTVWLLGASTIVGVTIATAWVFELHQGDASGTYWQGRYSLPLLVGAPVVLGAADLRPELARDVARGTSVATLLFVNVALWAAARRFGVGIDGSLLPWRWDTYDAPIPVVAALGLHAAATAGLLIVFRAPDRDPSPDGTRSPTVESVPR